MRTILCALAAERFTRKWVFAGAGDEGDPGAKGPSAAYSRSAAMVGVVTRDRDSWLMLAAAGLGGIVLVEVLYANSVAANFGQGYFIAAVAMLGGVLLGHQVFTTKAIWPAALAWLVPAVAGHIWAIMGQDVSAQWWIKGINPLADMLPIQYAAGGTIGGILGLWISNMLLRWREEQENG